MSGAGFMQFITNIVGLFAMIGLTWFALPKIAPDPWFAQMARYAIGAAGLMMLILIVGGIFFGGGIALAITVPGILEYAMALIVVVLVVMLLYIGVDTWRWGRSAMW